MNKKILAVVGIVLLLCGILASYQAIARQQNKKPKTFPSLNVKIQPETAKLHPQEHQLFMVVVYNGTPPFTYAWKANGTTVNCSEPTYDFTFQQPCNYIILSVKATDFHGLSGDDSVLVYDPSWESIPRYLESTLPFSYMIETNGTHYFMYNGTTWKKDMESTDAEAILEATDGNLTSGGRIFIRDGLYTFDDKWEISYSNIDVIGESWNTILKLGNEVNDHVIYAEGKSNIRVSNLKIDGNKAQQTGSASTTLAGINFWNSSYCCVDHVWTYNTTRYGVDFGLDSYYCGITNSRIENPTDNGILFHQAFYCYAIGNTVTGASDVGLSVANGSFNVFDNNWSFDNMHNDARTEYNGHWGAGIEYAGAKKNTFSNNWIWGNEIGIYTQTGGLENTFIGNHVFSHTTGQKKGMEIRGDYAIIDGNELDYNTGGSLAFFGDHVICTNNLVRRCYTGINVCGNNSLVSDNTVEANTGQWEYAGGIRLTDNAVGSEISTNYIIDNTGYGIYIASGVNDTSIKDNRLTNNAGGVLYDEGTNTMWGSGNIIGSKPCENSGTIEASNDDWFAHGLAGTPTSITLTVEESDATYSVQAKAKNTTHVQIYLYDITASELETVDKTINYIVEYKP